MKTEALFKGGGCILSAPFSYRYFKAEDSTLCHDWVNIIGDLSELTKRYGVECGRVYYPENNHNITTIVAEIETETLSKSKNSERMYELMVEELLIEMLREKSPGPEIRISSEAYNLMLSLRSELKTRYNTIKSIDAFVSDKGLSVSQFYLLYRQIFGISPKKDLIKTRIEHAKAMLERGQANLDEISELLGYDNYSHFSRQFKACVGVPPTKCKKICRKYHLLCLVI